MQTPEANPALLHRFLGIGLVIVAAALVIVRESTMTGESAQGISPLPAYGAAGAGAVMMAAALMLLKPLVPRRRAGQTTTAFWSDPATAAKAFRFWFILEGAGVIGAVSYFLGGGPYAAVIIAAVVVAFWMNGPRVFENE